MTTTVNIHQAETHFSKLIELVRIGEEIIIAKAGEPVARLVPEARPGKRRKLGAAKGEVSIAKDCDDPLPDDLPRSVRKVRSETLPERPCLPFGRSAGSS